MYDICADEGWVSVGTDHDTAPLAVQTIRRWWYTMGCARYPKARELTITADCGGSNGFRVRLSNFERSRLATKTGLSIRVRHFPPGTNKWNKIDVIRQRMKRSGQMRWSQEGANSLLQVRCAVLNGQDIRNFVRRYQPDRRIEHPFEPALAA